MKKRKVSKNVISGILLICLLLCSSVFAYADNSDNVSENISPEPVITQTTNTEVLRVSASDTSGFHSVILGLIGDYNPIAVTTSYQYPSGNTYQTRQQVDVEPDWSWIMSCALFIVIIYCLFRFLGSLVYGGKI